MNIEKILKRFGGTVYLTRGDTWRSSNFKAFIQPLRYKTKLYMQGERTTLGTNPNNVYLYIGPSCHDLSKLDSNYRIHDNDNNIYIIDRAEKITIQNKIVYVWAVIRKTSEVSQ